jgi:hypothetical protein
MSNDLDSKPIEIDPNSVPGQLAALGRYMLTAGGSFALGRGWIDGDVLTFITGLLTVAAPAAYGIWKTHQNKVLTVKLADAAPNTKAVVK